MDCASRRVSPCDAGLRFVNNLESLRNYQQACHGILIILMSLRFLIQVIELNWAMHAG